MQQAESFEPDLSSHAACIELQAPVDAGIVSARLALLCRDDGAREWVPDEPGFFVMRVPFSRVASQARRLCEEEMRRDAGEGPGRSWRLLLLLYADGSGDLMAVARRREMPGERLITVVRALASGEAVPAFGPVATAAPLPQRPDRADRPPWLVPGAPNRSRGWLVHRIETAEIAVVVAAIALVLDRFGGSEQAACLLRGETRVPIGAAIPDETGVTEFLARAATVSGPIGDTAAEETPTNLPWICLVVEPDRHDVTYLPATTPIAPLTISIVQAEDAVNVTCCYERSDVDDELVRTLVESVAVASERLIRAKPTELCRSVAVAPTSCEAAPPPSGGDQAQADLAAAFGCIASAQPEAVAVVAEDATWTYRELDMRADAVAAVLRDAGVRPGNRVGVAMSRSAELIATLLGILKIGAAYVPVDAHSPQERVRYIFEQVGAAAVVRDAGLCMAEDGTARTAADDGHDSREAYVIFTSGSTGRPKGVAVTHASVRALVEATREALALSPDDVWTFFHSVAFDFSVWEIWACLTTGGRLVVVPSETSRDPEAFLALLARERVSVLNQTPSAFRQLLLAERSAPLATPPRLLIFGGEPLDTRILKSWMKRHPPNRCRLLNMYGITETTVHATARDIVRADSVRRTWCVGRPIAGWGVDIRDRFGHPLPVGIPGEIWVHGCGVALGYVGRPDLTAAAFPVCSKTGVRMYRSGDLGRMSANGAIEHLGRVDQQVKVRGFRIELSEVEAVLKSHPSVADAAVAVRGDDEWSRRLDAFVVLAGADVADVAAYVRGLLPSYMVPTVTVVERLPLTVNGKLDIARLPAPGPQAFSDGSRPSSAVHEIWRSVLGVEIGPDDNLFEAGGSSLTAVRLVAAMKEAGFSVALRDVYANQTVASLARHIEAAGS